MNVILRYFLIILFSLLFFLSLTNIIFINPILQNFEKEKFTNNIKNIFSKECERLCLSNDCFSFCFNITNNSEICKEVCKNMTFCITSCKEQIEKMNSVFEQKINEIYETEFFMNHSLNKIIELQKNLFIPSIIFLIISIIFLFLILENPLSFFGKQIIIFGIGIITIKYIFDFLINKLLLEINIPNEIIINKILNYIIESFSIIFLYGLFFIIFGVCLIIINYILKKR